MAPAPSFITGPRRCPSAIKCKPGAAGRKDLTMTAHTYNAPTISAGTIAVAALVAWWKNNSFTTAALQADQTYNKLKAQGK
jgi:hypothetical protein